MLQLKNKTPFAASLMLLPDANGIDTLYGVVKGSFQIGARLALADEQLPVAVTDEHYGEPATSSIRVPSDVCLGKPSTDILLLGSAVAPNDTPAWQVDVSVTVGSCAKAVRVFGDRVWDTSAGVASMAWVAPFVRMPLVWERSFGGSDITDKGPACDGRNPVGIGFRASGGAKQVRGMAVPNVEDPNALITSPSDAPAPAGFGAVAPHWEPRKAFAGTYDDAWQRCRAPYLPTDFDARFFQSAPTGLVPATPLRGGEPVEILGATPEGALRFALPELGVRLTYRREKEEVERRAVLDTVLIEADARRLVLVWRAALNCDKAALKIREVEASLLPA
jgi:hypothetical protein